MPNSILMQVSFHLRKDKIGKAGIAPIRMVIATNGFKIFKAVRGVKCFENNWDVRKERIKAPKKNEAYNNFIEYNKIIDELETNLKTLERYMLLNDIAPTKEYIIEKLASGLKKIEIINAFFPSFEEFIESGKVIKAERTVMAYTTALNFLKEFESKSKYSLRFDTITDEFFTQFQEYCFLVKRTKNNYFARLITTLKTFMKWSLERDYHTNISFLKFKAPEDEIEVIYLTLDELMLLYNHSFDSLRLEHVRDVYCFGCFTGLRFSDIRSLRVSNLTENEIKLNIQKTRSIDHRIPLNIYAKSILKKYVETIYEPLPIISSQKFNKYIKECCQVVGLDSPTSITRYIGRKRLDKTVPKYELITSHTARKTFVTNSLVLGMKEMVVRNITGHKKEESFRRYVKIAENLKRSEMDNTWDKIKP